MKKHQTQALVIVLLALAAACARPHPTSSPTATFKVFFEAAKNKNADGIKKTLSKGSMEMIEGIAKAQNKTLDEALKTSTTDSAGTPEMRNEKIEGDTATLEVKNDRTNTWELFPFVKEDGQWKIAFDKYVRDAVQKFAEHAPSVPMPPSSPPPTGPKPGASTPGGKKP